MNLLEIDNALKQVLDNGFSVDIESGEILFDEDNLKELELTREAKLLGYAKYIKNLEAEVKALKEHKASIDDRIKAKSKKMEWLKERAVSSLDEKESIEDVEVVMKKNKGREIVHIINEVPQVYQRVTTKTEPDKKMILKDLKEGKELGFATIKRNPTLSIK